MARVNRAIELLEQGQPVFFHSVLEPSFETGVMTAGTWADFVSVEMEHYPYDMVGLRAFMKGLLAGGPTRSGHLTPAVVVSLPMQGTSEDVVRANAWQVHQVLDTGVHGIILCHAETTAAVRAFVESARYPIHTVGVGEDLGIGRRGSHIETWAASVWGVSVEEYPQLADVWPLNPKGEIILGVKTENRRALANVEDICKAPGVAFADWGVIDMGMSFGYPLITYPYPPEVEEANARVLDACKAAGIGYIGRVDSEDVVERVKAGVNVCFSPELEKPAEIARKHFGRTMPW